MAWVKGELDVQVIWCKTMVHFPYMDYAVALSSSLQGLEFECCQPVVVVEALTLSDFLGKEALYILKYLYVCE